MGPSSVANGAKSLLSHSVAIAHVQMVATPTIKAYSSDVGVKIKIRLSQQQLLFLKRA